MCFVEFLTSLFILFVESFKLEKDKAVFSIVLVLDFTMASLDLLFYKKTGNQQTTLPHGISGVAVHVDQHNAKNCLILLKFERFHKALSIKTALSMSSLKDSTKRIYNLLGF